MSVFVKQRITYIHTHTHTHTHIYPHLFRFFSRGATDRFQKGKGVCQGCVQSPCLSNLYTEYIIKTTGLDEAQAGIKIAGEISITSDIQMTPPLWQKEKKN